MSSSPIIDPHKALDGPEAGPVGRGARQLKALLVRVLGLLAARLLRPSALLDPVVRSSLWRAGLAVQPKGFYSSLVDPWDLPRSAALSKYRGVDFNPTLQHHYVSEVLPRFQAEFAALPQSKPKDFASSPRFFIGNDAFDGIDALAYWAMIRQHRPKRIVEVGSGHSTLLGAQALRVNGSGLLVAIDPYPREFIREANDCVMRREHVQETPIGVFASLERDDILFVDGSHVVRSGGDANFVFLDVLPTLRPGVLVHVHDIHFPFDYPTELISDRNVYWTEQYLLHAYLIGNRTSEVVFGSRYCGHVFPDETGHAFPSVSRPGGASFWIRTVSPDAEA